jgi:hypothetical protein
LEWQGPTVIKILSILKDILNSNSWVREVEFEISSDFITFSDLSMYRLRNSQLPNSRTRIFELRIFLRILKAIHLSLEFRTPLPPPPLLYFALTKLEIVLWGSNHLLMLWRR